MREIAILPRPTEITACEGVFKLTPDTRILTSGETLETAETLQALLQAASGVPLAIEKNRADQDEGSVIRLVCTEAERSLGNEGYRLAVNPDQVVIRAYRAAGIFYGIQSLRQLLPVEIEGRGSAPDFSWSVPCVTIRDQPRFPWRGMMLDVGRHMFSLDFIKRYIDLMALQKMNVFHWHLTEDQGWRIEIKKHPKLTKNGAWRTSSPLPGKMEEPDGQRYGGYYTHSEIREIVTYAARRFITVLPEIEMPGHTVSALVGYPELGCTGGPYAVRTSWGIEKDIFCAGNEETFAFLKDVLAEVLELFPGQYIHIGGDECPKDRWKVCPKCQARIKDNGLKDEEELQSYFIQRIEKYLNEKGRRMIGWDEILEGGLAPHATVMSWRGMQGGLAAAQAGHDVIMSPTSHCYLDYPQTEEVDPILPGWMDVTTLEKAYSFEPVPEHLSAEEATHILGAQANLWTEFVTTTARAESMIYPRASALAEVMWSAAQGRDFEEFSKRLKAFLARLDKMGVQYWKDGDR